MGGCAECGCGWYNPEDGRVADCHRCTGGDGWQETGFQLSHSGENSGTFQAVGGSGAA